MSPWAFVLTLKEAAESFHQLPLQSPGKQALFVDDRQAFVHRPQDVARVIQHWDSWCTQLGLRENAGKKRIVANHRAHEESVKQFVAHNLVVPQVRILGVDIRQKERGLALTAEQREKTGLSILARVALLPLAPGRRSHLARTRALTMITWGRWTAQLSWHASRRIGTRIKKAVAASHSGARDLWEMLQGHWTCGWLSQLCDCIATWVRAAAYWSSHHIVFRGEVLFSNIKEAMYRLGYRYSVDGGLRHSSLPVVSWPWEPRHGNCKQWIDKALHKVREAWRVQRFEAFLTHDRRDRAALRGLVQYSENVAKRARLHFQNSNQTVRAIMVGSGYSSACYEIMRGEALSQSCRFCGGLEPPGLEHLVWRCPFFSCSRPPDPGDLLARRLAWPWPGATKQQVERLSAHFEKVVRAIRHQDGFNGADL